MTGLDGAVRDAPPIPRELADEYERLRDAATGSRDVAGRQGLGILIRKGMAVWMRACAAVPTTSPASCSHEPGASAAMLPQAQRDVVDVLTAMVLTIAMEVTA